MRERVQEAARLLRLDPYLDRRPLALSGGQYQPDWAGWEGRLTGAERMLILCSPHNPGGTVWTRDEIRALADFAAVHDLVLVSDEIHHDLTFPGTAFVPTAVAAVPWISSLKQHTLSR